MKTEPVKQIPLKAFLNGAALQEQTCQLNRKSRILPPYSRDVGWKASAILSKQREEDRMKNPSQCDTAEVLEEMEGTPAISELDQDTAKQTNEFAEAEVQLNKLFLARLDVRSRIADFNRNRAKLLARKIDVEAKIASLVEFDKKLMKKEEEICRALAES